VWHALKLITENSLYGHPLSSNPFDADTSTKKGKPKKFTAHDQILLVERVEALSFN
jgi:hypothetical protein